jgi:hypothetical protein
MEKGSLRMAPIFVPSQSAEDWQKFLADPHKQWRKGYSARTTAHAWQAAAGLPVEIQTLFEESGFEPFENVETLLVIPEHKVNLPPIKGHPSQNDVFALLKAADGELVSVMVEAKVSESFDKLVGEWIADESPGKYTRLDFLMNLLELEGKDLGLIRYQLLHRTASAILEAQRFNAAYAAMVVQSFSPTEEWFEDYAQFLNRYDVQAKIGQLHHLGAVNGVALFSGWARGDPRFLEA